MYCVWLRRQGARYLPGGIVRPVSAPVLWDCPQQHTITFHAAALCFHHELPIIASGSSPYVRLSLNSVILFITASTRRRGVDVWPSSASSIEGFFADRTVRVGMWSASDRSHALREYMTTPTSCAPWLLQVSINKPKGSTTLRASILFRYRLVDGSKLPISRCLDTSEGSLR